MNRDQFFTALRRRKSNLFGTSLSPQQTAGIGGILDAFETHGDGQAKTLAYALATAYHETAGAMVPIKETVMPHHKNKHPSDDEVARRLDAWARKTGRTNRYWDKTPPYGHRYFGRGLVQITHAANYRASSKDAGVDLLANPDEALNPEIAARILIKGLLDGRWNGKGKGIAYYLVQDDLKNARRTVNVLDKWEDVAAHYDAFLIATQAAGGISATLPIDLPDLPATDDPVASGGILALIAKLIERILKWIMHR